jgi:Secretion system C-terminal sorting domain
MVSKLLIMLLRFAIVLSILTQLLFTARAQQPFQKTYAADTAFVEYAKDEFSAILPTPNGYLLAGSTQGYQNISSAGLLVWVDSNGVATQSISYRDGYINRFKSLADAGNGNVMLAGTGAICNFEQCPTKMVVANINPQGQTNWSFEVSGGGYNYGQSIKAAANGNYIASGWYDNFGEQRGYDVLATKLTAAGDTLWVRAYGTADNEYTYDATETSSGHVVVTANQNGNILLVKLQPDGSLLWAKNYGRGAARKIISTPNGYLIAGHKSAGGVFEITDPFILKVDTNGTPQYFKTFYGADYDYLSDIQPTANGYILAGTTTSFAYDVTDLYLINCDTLGNLNWARAYGSYEYDEGITALPIANGGFLASGYTASFNNSNGTRYHAWLLKTDILGSTGNCADHSAFPLVIEHSVTPQNISLLKARRINVISNTYLTENYPLEDKTVCPNFVGVDEEPTDNALSIYPNPSNGLVTIQSYASIGYVQVYNNLGQLVYADNSPAMQTKQVDLTTFANGVYTIKMGTVFRKIVLQK